MPQVKRLTAVTCRCCSQVAMSASTAELFLEAVADLRLWDLGARMPMLLPHVHGILAQTL
eukprot:363070-Chlamydomonas_euryale.AAC.2